MSTKRQQFIEFFSAIPDDQWIKGGIPRLLPDGRRQACAISHVELTKGHDETSVLFSMRRASDPSNPSGSAPEQIGSINDGHDPRYQQATPKARILAWLNDLKD